jgi:biopolymer transport protein ExbD
MKFKRHLQLEHGVGQLETIPLITIIFQLLLFFVLTSSFIFQPGLQIKLPRAVTSEVLNERNLVITISPENIFYLDGKAVTLDELKNRIGKIKTPDTSVLIKADKKVLLGKVAQIWDLCREIGLEKVNVATNQE